jgi:altronate dehydratase
MTSVVLDDIGRIPAPGDNVAIAIRRIEAGTEFDHGGGRHTLPHTILEAHRFTIEPVARNAELRSWGLPFGVALRDITPGEWLCNAGILEELALRGLDFPLPASPNFRDEIRTHRLDESSFRPGRQVPMVDKPGTFDGFLRSGGRGIGTRNFIVLLGTSSLTASFVRTLEARLNGAAAGLPGIDGIVAVAHTEGGEGGTPNNREFLLRTLAGFLVHPNVGAVLAVDYGTEPVNNVELERYARARHYALDHVLHRFYTIRGAIGAALDAGERIARGWLKPVNETRRSKQPLAGMKIGLQCGGSDAFSGISGNPLAGWIAKEAIRHGGSASLAETDELIGAEPYILNNARDLGTAQRFLDKVAIFKERVAWHGHTAEDNPTGGNKYRGLFNIAIKSIGAARKKDPDVRLDYVIDYAAPMPEPGFYFMDSPGNDLESIAGQVASGCNMIFFTTGNGSITNFPFVPTIKFMTTTRRFELLSQDMDINAGRYQDGVPMEQLGREGFDYAVKVASGTRSVGERAGHAQVSIWRNWRQRDRSQLDKLRNRPKPDGRPIPLATDAPAHATFDALPAGQGWVADQVGLILPTSLCSGQIALRIAARLNERRPAAGPVSRYVALPHTEGCGTSGGENEEHYLRTAAGHLVHPFVHTALLLEHGCEHTHNDLMRHALIERGVDPARFGYASVQLDGGIDKVVDKVARWFGDRLAGQPAAERRAVGLEHLSIALLSIGAISDPVAAALARVAQQVAGSGGTVVMPENATLLASAAFRSALGLTSAPAPSLDYGQVADRHGLHVMATPTAHGVETLTGLGGTGVQLVLAHISGPPLQAHPMVPVLQITADPATQLRFGKDFDLAIDPTRVDAAALGGELLQLICDTASQHYRPRLWSAGYTDFQLTRGELGVSM